MQFPRRRLIQFVLSFLGLVPAVAIAQTCNCSCDPFISPCDAITLSMMNESGQNASDFLTTGVNPPTTVREVRHANQFTAGAGTQFTHVCLAIKVPDGSASPQAVVWFAGDMGGLPGGAFYSQYFTVAPQSAGASLFHQVVRLNTPVTVNGTFWVGVSFPSATLAYRPMGVRPRTQGQSAVYLDGYGWHTYDNWATTYSLTGFLNMAPVIRPLRVEPGNQRVVASQYSGHVTNEYGRTSFFDVWLDALKPPTSTVYINVSSSRPDEALPTPTQLQFDQFNWHTPQRITITGQDDPFYDGDQPYTIHLTIAPPTSDPCWLGALVPGITGINLDNEPPCSGPPTVTAPQDITVVTPQSVTMAVSVFGPGPNTFQWRHNGVVLVNGPHIAGADTATLTIIGAQPADAGRYHVLVTGPCGSATSPSGMLTVLCPSDVDDGSGTGTPDGGVTIDDLLYYLGIFAAGSIRADLDDGSATGTPDGGVTIDDLLYFLARFAAGC